jgi:hypothetical protein
MVCAAAARHDVVRLCSRLAAARTRPRHASLLAASTKAGHLARAFCASLPARSAVPGLQGCRHLCHSCSGQCGVRSYDPSDCRVWRALCPHAVSCWRVKAARHGSLGRRDRPCPRAAVGRGIGVRRCVICTVESDVLVM